MPSPVVLTLTSVKFSTCEGGNDVDEMLHVYVNGAELITC